MAMTNGSTLNLKKISVVGKGKIFGDGMNLTIPLWHVGFLSNHKQRQTNPTNNHQQSTEWRNRP